ncbi:MAG: hypothetical protein JWL71_3982 [Acidobacteria bacterium]|nr:hypothetical protein [Acidobacteriota bacterium]
MKLQLIVSALVITAATFATACSRDVAALSPQQVESDYGVAGAHTGEVSTADGRVKGTLVPVTLADGRQGQLLIPTRSRNEPHGVYLQDNQGLHPVELSPGTTRSDIQTAPRVVARRAEPAHKNKRSWEQEALIIGGAAGGGAGIGALAGGKKGAGVGAAVGGVGGLIYDLATRK